MSATQKTRITQRGAGTWIEFFREPGNGQGFIAIARGSDREDDERVIILSPAQGAKLGWLLLSWAESCGVSP